MVFAAQYLYLLVILPALVLVVLEGWPGAEGVLLFAVFSLPLAARSNRIRKTSERPRAVVPSEEGNSAGREPV